jgi:hypothetical protein
VRRKNINFIRNPLYFFIGRDKTRNIKCYYDKREDSLMSHEGKFDLEPLIWKERENEKKKKVN